MYRRLGASEHPIRWDATQDFVLQSVALRNYFSGLAGRFDVQILQTDKVLFCLSACRLSAENSERASLKSVTKI